ncbi:hypothetical protein MXL46_04975 [Heyndrickxia sporothermodurans]|uniref:hypothetical protein n=1 Tax=Heyndrickxia sporothermodurans TaxID=46224 RepID=UPI002DB8C89C|nr:hypothetical protein [Heyndrickxia sporothermodurans]MEB6548459.1 hypothetical protein [Heyndrickxia sporothermodurans]MED3781714.1 hypothetical protein [Heyndrickxia sporothermodurans]
MNNNVDYFITKEMVVQYDDLNRKKKEIEKELEKLKKAFNQYFDVAVGKNVKGELNISGYKLQRQIRKSEKFEQDETVKRLEELNMMDLIQRKPDEGKIKSALNLGLLKEADLEGCIKQISSQAIYVKQITTNE